MTQSTSGKLQACTLTRVKASLASALLIYIAGFFIVDWQNRPALIFWFFFLPLWEFAVLGFVPLVRMRFQREPPPPAVTVLARDAEVVLYTGLGCPYCPFVHRRLERLQSAMGFELKVVDLTLHPQLAAEKRIASVPVVEARGERVVGNAGIPQLMSLITGSKLAQPE